MSDLYELQRQSGMKKPWRGRDGDVVSLDVKAAWLALAADAYWRGTGEAAFRADQAYQAHDLLAKRSYRMIVSAAIANCLRKAKGLSYREVCLGLRNVRGFGEVSRRSLQSIYSNP